MAIKKLAGAGYQNDYNIFDGMELDMVQDPENGFHGKHMKIGWKNAGLTRTYDLAPNLVCHPPEDKMEEIRTALDFRSQ